MDSGAMMIDKILRISQIVQGMAVGCFPSCFPADVQFDHVEKLVLRVRREAKDI